jgi:hypothetical protein
VNETPNRFSVWYKAAIALLSAEFLLCLALASQSKPEMAQPTRSSSLVNSLRERYTGQTACSPCHREIFEAFRSLGMGRSWQTPDRAEVIEDYSHNNTFYHQKSGFYYTMLHKDGKFYQRRYLLDSQKTAINVHEEEVTYVVGSGNHARSYLHHHENGVITQLPVSWYPQEKR